MYLSKQQLKHTFVFTQHSPRWPPPGQLCQLSLSLSLKTLYLHKHFTPNCVFQIHCSLEYQYVLYTSTVCCTVSWGLVTKACVGLNNNPICTWYSCNRHKCTMALFYTWCAALYKVVACVVTIDCTLYETYFTLLESSCIRWSSYSSLAASHLFVVDGVYMGLKCNLHCTGRVRMCFFTYHSR